MGDGTLTTSSFTPDPIYGGCCGIDYTITVVAEAWNDEEDDEEENPSASYTLTVHKPILDSDGDTVQLNQTESVTGYVQITAKWSGKTGSASLLTRTDNDTNETIRAVSVFSFWVRRKKGGVIEDVSPPQPADDDVYINAGGTSCANYGNSYTISGNWGQAGEYVDLEVRAKLDVYKRDPDLNEWKSIGDWEAKGTTTYEF